MLSTGFLSTLVRRGAPILLFFFVLPLAAQTTKPTTSTLTSVYEAGKGFDVTCRVSGPARNWQPALNGSVTLNDLTGGQSLGTADLGPSSPYFASFVGTYGGFWDVSLLVAADFNDDGKDDLALPHSFSKDISILLGKGDGSFQAAAPVTPKYRPWDIAAGKFTSSGNWDLAVTAEDNSALDILLGDGKGGFTQSYYPISSSPDESYGRVVTADFNKDGNTDVAIMGRNGGLYVFLGKGDGTFKSLPSASIWSGILGWQSIAAATLTSSGYPDLVVNTGGSSNSAYVLLGNGDGTFRTGPNVPATSSSHAMVAADLNGDGKQDLVLSQASGIAVLLGNGNGTFQNPVYSNDGPTAEDSSRFMLAGDFLGNGKLDIVSADVNGMSPTLYPGNGDGTFEAAINRVWGSFWDLGVEPFAAGNFSGNGALGLAGVDSSDDAIFVWPEGPVETASATLDDVNFTSLIDQAHQVDCSYSGDANYAQSTSAAISLKYAPAPTPAINPVAGTYVTPTTVTITSPYAPEIHYTTDGSTPTSASTPYAGPFSVSSSATVKAIASGPGYAHSKVAAAAYTIRIPAALSLPAPSSVLTGARATFAWTAGSGATGYNLMLGSTAGGHDIYGAGTTTVTSVTLYALPTHGETIYARLYTYFPTNPSPYVDYSFTAANPAAAALSSPTPSSTLTGNRATFAWTAGNGSTGYNLMLGSTAGGHDIYGAGTTTATSVTLYGLPTNGKTIYARLYTYFPAGIQSKYVDYIFMAATQTAAALSSPAPSSVLTGPKATFAWTAGSGATGYNLMLGSTAGGHDIYGAGTTRATSVTLYGLPTNGKTIYARLYTYFPTNPSPSVDYIFTAATQ